jgi:fibronectin type 3 domain-containing protein
VRLTNTSSSAVTISQDPISGSGFTVGVTTPLTLAASSSVNIPVVFKPGTAGAVNGSLGLVSNGTTALSIPLTGTGFAALAHSVALTWLASSSSPLQGYNVYRGTISGGPYSKISSTLSPTTLAFSDTTPVSGKQYFYVVTALNTSGAESVASSEVAVTIPIP